MKNLILTVLLGLFIANIFTACATKRYGRLQNVSEKEEQYISCRELDIEIDKAESFKRNVSYINSDFSREDVFGFLGDLGIGNRMEYSQAQISAEDRLDDLKRIYRKKNCME